MIFAVAWNRLVGKPAFDRKNILAARSLEYEFSFFPLTGLYGEMNISSGLLFFARFFHSTLAGLFHSTLAGFFHPTLAGFFQGTFASYPAYLRRRAAGAIITQQCVFDRVQDAVAGIAECKRPFCCVLENQLDGERRRRARRSRWYAPGNFLGLHHESFEQLERLRAIRRGTGIARFFEELRAACGQQRYGQCRRRQKTNSRKSHCLHRCKEME